VLLEQKPRHCRCQRRAGQSSLSIQRWPKLRLIGDLSKINGGAEIHRPRWGSRAGTQTVALRFLSVKRRGRSKRSAPTTAKPNATATAGPKGNIKCRAEKREGLKTKTLPYYGLTNLVAGARERNRLRAVLRVVGNLHAPGLRSLW
jgi:hypothetical protein